MTETDLFERFRKLTADLLDVAAEQVVTDARFAEELGVDSLDLVELVEALEAAFGISIDDEELAEVTTVGEAFALLEGKVISS